RPWPDWRSVRKDGTGMPQDVRRMVGKPSCRGALPQDSKIEEGRSTRAQEAVLDGDRPRTYVGNWHPLRTSKTDRLASEPPMRLNSKPLSFIFTCTRTHRLLNFNDASCGLQESRFAPQQFPCGIACERKCFPIFCKTLLSKTVCAWRLHQNSQLNRLDFLQRRSMALNVQR